MEKLILILGIFSGWPLATFSAQLEAEEVESSEFETEKPGNRSSAF